MKTLLSPGASTQARPEGPSSQQVTAFLEHPTALMTVMQEARIQSREYQLDAYQPTPTEFAAREKLPGYSGT